MRTVIAHGTRLVRTLARGTTVYGDGTIQVQPGFGRFLSSQEAAVAVGV